MSITRKPVSNLVGKKFNRLTVVEYLGVRKWGKHWWRCMCDCGTEVEINTSRITGKSSSTKSCGCLRRESMTKNRADPYRHGLHKHKLYAIYYQMLQRCYNPNSQRYKYYGGSGIHVCSEWQENFLEFYSWAINNGWEDGLSIDRVDNTKGYSPRNCEWVTVSENSRRMNETRIK